MRPKWGSSFLSGSQFRWGLPQIDAELLTEKWGPAGIKKPWQSWQDLYEVLGLPEDADEATIKKAGNRYGKKNDSVVWVQAGWLDHDRWCRHPNSQINNWFFEASEIEMKRTVSLMVFEEIYSRWLAAERFWRDPSPTFEVSGCNNKNMNQTHHGLTPWWVEGKIELKLGEIGNYTKAWGIYTDLERWITSMLIFRFVRILFDNYRTKVPCSTNRMVTNPEQFALRSTESFRFSFLAKEMPEIPQRRGQIPSLRLT